MAEDAGIQSISVVYVIPDLISLSLSSSIYDRPHYAFIPRANFQKTVRPLVYTPYYTEKPGTNVRVRSEAGGAYTYMLHRGGLYEPM